MPMSPAVTERAAVIPLCTLGLQTRVLRQGVRGLAGARTFLVRNLQAPFL